MVLCDYLGDCSEEANKSGIGFSLNDNILEILLKDRTTGKNILWATDNYISNGTSYQADKPIELQLISDSQRNPIKPRTMKSVQEQTSRTKDMAETFTPSWVCNKQNNLVDEAWFGRKDVFNKEEEKNWITIEEKIVFHDVPEKTWIDYVKAPRMEMTCGEAPYLVSRYDTTTGEQIQIKNRIGLLDRKLRIVGENTSNQKDWIKWATEAFKAIYGFEFQGDNLLLARENLMLTFIEYYQERFNKLPTDATLKKIATIISWNLWQMDGLKFVVPYSCVNEVEVQLDLFGDDDESLLECKGCQNGDIHLHNGTYCKIKDWSQNKVIEAVSLL